MNTTNHFPDPAGSSVLIVDDNPRNLQLISSLLKNQGYKLYITNSGENALKFLETNQPDLILLDIMMPEMSGFEVCRNIKQNEAYQNIPIIFITAKNDIEDIVQGFELGAVDYITKPFNSKEVLARVSTQIKLKMAQNLLIEKNLELATINKELADSKSVIEKDAERLAQLNAEKNKFFSIIAHDLRGPLSGLEGISKILVDKTGKTRPEEINELAVLLLDSSTQVFNLLEDLLEWAQLQMNVTTFSPTVFPLNRIVNTAIYLLEHNLAKKNISLKNSIPADLNINADPSMLKTIIRNIVSNAVKFTPKNGKIELTAKSLDHDSIQIAISDTGIGMDRQLLEKLFKLDQKTARQGTEGETSSGLGLILCKDLIDKHNGKITVESTVGKGTTFFITFHNQSK
jgi:signal transduction histidine kinase